MIISYYYRLLFAVFLPFSQAYPEFIVLGYAPSWSVNPNQIRYELYTHINYAFVLPAGTSGNLGNVPQPQKLRDIVQLAKDHDVKVSLSIGGWNNGDDSDFETLSNNENSRTRFVTETISLVTQYDLDGVDIDWEYPDPGNSAENYLLLMQELGDSLNIMGKLLTAAVVSYGGTGGGIKEEVFQIVDFLNLMSYDGTDHATVKQYEDTWNYWINRGLPPEKIVMGLPFYCRGAGQFVDYADIISNDPNNVDLMNYNNGCIYSNLSMTKEKTSNTYNQGGLGVMFWELTGDTHDEATSLLVGINQVVDSLDNTNNINRNPASKIQVSYHQGKYIELYIADPGYLSFDIRSSKGEVVERLETMQSSSNSVHIKINENLRGLYFLTGTIDKKNIPVTKILF